MRSSPISILVVEDNIDICLVLKSFFDIQTGVEFIGEAHNGIEAIEKIRALAPDVVIMDIVMPMFDGLSVLEYLRENPQEKRPVILLTSAGGQEQITKAAAELGADYFMMKPYSLDAMLNRIFLLMEKSGADRQLKFQEANNQLARFVISLGVPTHILGYKYITQAISILLTQTAPCAIGKKVYSTIAKDNSTTEDCVERAVRQALSCVYKNQTDVFFMIMHYCNASLDKRPTNAQFLKMVTEYLRLNKL
jgi:two-component system response regulator (stage 0 sporulation protein A)